MRWSTSNTCSTRATQTVRLTHTDVVGDRLALPLSTIHWLPLLFVFAFKFGKAPVCVCGNSLHTNSKHFLCLRKCSRSQVHFLTARSHCILRLRWKNSRSHTAVQSAVAIDCREKKKSKSDQRSSCHLLCVSRHTEHHLIPQYMKHFSKYLYIECDCIKSVESLSHVFAPNITSELNIM